MITLIEITNFINDNSDETVKNYYEKIYEKQKNINGRVDKTSLHMILTALAFFIFAYTKSSNLELGPFVISDLNFLFKIIPIYFAYLCFQYTILSTHKGELMKLTKQLSLHLYKQRELEKIYFVQKLNIFSRLLLPFSQWTDIFNIGQDINGKKSRLIQSTLLFPIVISLALAPIYFEYIVLIYLWNHFQSDWFCKVSIALSIWFLLITIYYFIGIIISNYKIIRQSGDF